MEKAHSLKRKRTDLDAAIKKDICLYKLANSHKTQQEIAEHFSKKIQKKLPAQHYAKF